MRLKGKKSPPMLSKTSMVFRFRTWTSLRILTIATTGSGSASLEAYLRGLTWKGSDSSVTTRNSPSVVKK